MVVSIVASIFMKDMRGECDSHTGIGLTPIMSKPLAPVTLCTLY